MDADERSETSLSVKCPMDLGVGGSCLTSLNTSGNRRWMIAAGSETSCDCSTILMGPVRLHENVDSGAPTMAHDFFGPPLFSLAEKLPTGA